MFCAQRDLFNKVFELVTSSPPHVLIFGASGAIGSALADTFFAKGWLVTGISRDLVEPTSSVGRWIRWAPGASADEWQALPPGTFSAVVWAQGTNYNDDIHTFDLARHEQMYRANVLVILESLRFMLDLKLLTGNARLCIISSIWQNIARGTKLSYCVTKSALQGLVQSLAIDLGPDGILVNAVLPGALRPA